MVSLRPLIPHQYIFEAYLFRVYFFSREVLNIIFADIDKKHSGAILVAALNKKETRDEELPGTDRSFVADAFTFLYIFTLQLPLVRQSNHRSCVEQIRTPLKGMPGRVEDDEACKGFHDPAMTAIGLYSTPEVLVIVPQLQAYASGDRERVLVVGCFGADLEEAPVFRYPRRSWFVVTDHIFIHDRMTVPAHDQRKLREGGDMRCITRRAMIIRSAHLSFYYLFKDRDRRKIFFYLFVEMQRNGAVILQVVGKENIECEILFLRPGMDGEMRFGETNDTRISSCFKVVVYFADLRKMAAHDLFVDEFLEGPVVGELANVGNPEIGNNVQPGDCGRQRCVAGKRDFL